MVNRKIARRKEEADLTGSGPKGFAFKQHRPNLLRGQTLLLGRVVAGVAVAPVLLLANLARKILHHDSLPEIFLFKHHPRPIKAVVCLSAAAAAFSLQLADPSALDQPRQESSAVAHFVREVVPREEGQVVEQEGKGAEVS